MDQFYFESGYIEPSYFVYTAEAKIDLTPYIGEGFIDANYYEYFGMSSSLVGSLDLVVGEVKEFEAVFASVSTATVTVFKIIDFACDAGSLFTPNILVNAILRPDVFIESAVTITVTANVNRSTTMAIDSLANVNAQSDITRGYQSILTATSTVQALAGTIKPYQAQLESTSTQSTTAITVELAQAAVTATAALTADGFISNKRPRIYTEVGSPTVNTSIKKFGLGSADLGEDNYLVIPSSTDFTAWRTVDVWFYLPNVSGSQTSNIITTNDFHLDITRVGPSPDGISPVIAAPSGKVIFFNTIAGKRNQWVHLRLVRGGASPYFHLWIDGDKATVSFSDTVNDSIGSGSTTVNLGYRNSSSREIYLDELLIRDDQLTDPSVSSFTPPTDRWKPTDQTNIEVLSHFDTDFSDDLGIFQLASSTQTVTATLTATGTAVKDLDSVLATTTTVTVAAVKTVVIDSAVTSESTVSATASKTIVATATVTSVAIATATVVKTTDSVIDAGSLFTPNILVNAILRPDVFLESAATATTTAAKTTDTLAAISTLAEQTTTAVKTVDAVSGLSVAVEQITVGDRTASITADLNCQADITATANRVRDLDSVLTSTATVTVDASSFTEAVIDPLTTTATVITLAVKTTDVASSNSTVATATATAARFRLTTVSLTSDASLAMTATRVRPADSALASEFAQTTTATKTVDSDTVLAAGSTLEAVCNYSADATTQFDSIAITITAAVKNTNNEVIISTAATVSAIIGAVKQFRNFGTNTGLQIQQDRPMSAQLLVEPFFKFKVRTKGFTASQWIKREDNLGSTLEVIWSQTPQTGLNGGGLVFQNTDLLFRFNFDDDEPNPRWIGVAPVDQQWHHYLIRAVDGELFDSSNAGGTTQWRLWIDGVDRGLSSGYFAGGQITFFDRGTFNAVPIGEVRLGHGSVTPVPFTNSTSRLIGAMAQLWMGYTGDDVDVADFYDGFRDFGDDGRRGGLLPTPNVYNRLSDPWSDIIEDIAGAPQPIQNGLASTEALDFPTTFALASLDVGFIGVFLFAVEMPVTVTLSADIERFPGFAGALTSTAAITAQAVKTTDTAATTSSTTAVSVTETRVRTTDLALNSQFTINAQPGELDQGQGDFTATVTLTADITLIPPIRATADLTTESTLIVTAVKDTDTTALLASLGELTADITLIPPIRATADLTAETAFTAAVTTQISATVVLNAQSTLTLTPTKFTGIILDLPAQATLDSTATKFTGIGATLVEAMAFQITLGSVINLAENLTLVILPESRTVTIGAETREITVLSETRVNTIYRG